MVDFSSQSKRLNRTKELILAALKTFSLKGYHATQISDIIQSAGVARGTFYLYFKGKREIFANLLDHIFAEVRGVVETLPRDPEAALQIPSKVKGNLLRLTELFCQKPEYARVLLCESVSLDPESDERLRHFYGQLLTLIQSALRQGQEMGFVREGNVAYLSVFLLGLIKELFYQKILKTYSFDAKGAVEELYKTILSTVARPELLKIID